MATDSPNPIADYLNLPCSAAADTIVAGDLEAVFLPGCGMLGVSLRHEGSELLRRLEGLPAAAAKGSTAGIPLLHLIHPYFGLPDLPRVQWRLELPAMRRCVLDRHGIPTGEEEAFAGFSGPLGDRICDDGFAVRDERPSFSLWGAGRRITVEFLAGFPYAQVFAPPGKDFVAIEPMTAPTNALGNGRGLRIVEAGAEFRAAFRIGVEKIL